MVSDHNYFTDSDIPSQLILNTETDSGAPVFLSFFVPTLRRVDTLKSALDSIYRQPGLSEINYEVIVTDNSADFTSNNPTRVLLETHFYPNLKYYINEKNLGMEGNWNRGIWLARGKFISILHDDDLLADCYLTMIQEVLSHNTNPGFVKVMYSIFMDEANLPELKLPTSSVQRCFLLESLLTGLGPTWTPSCGMIFNRDAVISAGGFKQELNPSADHELGIRILQKGYRGYQTMYPLSYYRIGVNESMKLSTLQGFVKQDTGIREYMYSTFRFGRLFRFLFEKALYSERIDFWIGYSKQYFSKPLSISDLDYRNSYCPCRVSKQLLCFLRKVYFFLLARIGG